MNFDDVCQAVRQAKATLELADAFAEGLARLLIGRLHHVSSGHVLAQLKRELRDFNIHTHEWKK